MQFNDERAERLYQEHFATMRVKSDQFFGALQVVVSVMLTMMFGADPDKSHPRNLLWSSTAFSLLCLAPSVLSPRARLYIKLRHILLFAARVVLAVMMPELVYQLVLFPYQGSSVTTRTRAAFFGMWFWHSRWLGEQIAIAGFLTTFNSELVLIPTSMFADMGNNARLCRELLRQNSFHRGMFNQLAATWEGLVAPLKSVLWTSKAGDALEACMERVAPPPPSPPGAAVCPAEDYSLIAFLDSHDRAAAFCRPLFFVSQVLFTLVLPLVLAGLRETRSRRHFLAAHPHLNGVRISYEQLWVAIPVLVAAIVMFVGFVNDISSGSQ